MEELNVKKMIDEVNAEVRTLLSEGDGVLKVDDGVKTDDGKINTEYEEGVF